MTSRRKIVWANLSILGGLVTGAIVAYALMQGSLGARFHAKGLHGAPAVPAASPPEEEFSPLPGMPPILNRKDIYSETRPGHLSPVVKAFPSRVYVPNTVTNTVDVIDPNTFRVIDHFRVGRQPQHVTPSYDLRTLWVLNDLGDSLTKIDPATGQKGETVPVKDPYNMYYSPDGKYAIVVAERVKRLDFRDAATMKLIDSVPVPCRGVDHMDFSADGRYLIASCEFSGMIVKLDVAKRAVLGTLLLPLEHPAETISAAPPVSRQGRSRFMGTRVHHGQLRTAEGGCEVDDSRRRKPGYGRRFSRRQGAMALGPLPPGSLCHRYG